MIVRTEGYTREQVGRVVQLRADIEGLKLSEAVVQRLAAEGERTSLRFVIVLLLTSILILASIRYALQLLAPAAILATLAGRTQIEEEDISEMGELFLDAKTSAAMISGDPVGPTATATPEAAAEEKMATDP